MIADLQKASLLKRLSAYLLDMILLLIAVTGMALLLSSALGYDDYNASLKTVREKYETQYGVSFDADTTKLSEDELARHTEAFEAFSADEEVIYLYNMQFNLILLILSLSLLLAHLLLEFLLPLLFRNGQTVGKKIFGLALMRTDGVRVSSVALFTRTVLGKYTVETMVPLSILLLVIVGPLGLFGTIAVLAMLVLQAALLLGTKAHTCIHDLMAVTVVVELSSQMIFDSEEAMLEYRKRLHSERVEQTKS